MFLAGRPDVNLVDIAGELGATERTAYGIVADLTAAGSLVKERDGRRNRYHVQHHLPIPDGLERQRTIGELLDVLMGTPIGLHR